MHRASKRNTEILAITVWRLTPIDWPPIQIRTENCSDWNKPIAYVQRLRVEAAKRQLELGDDAVDEISYRIGYADPAFFNRLFKRTTGLTPGAYRKKFRAPLVRNLKQ